MLINRSFLLYRCLFYIVLNGNITKGGCKKTHLCCFHKYFKSNQAIDFCFISHEILQMYRFYKLLWRSIIWSLNARYLEMSNLRLVLFHMLITHIIGMSRSKQAFWKTQQKTIELKTVSLESKVSATSVLTMQIMNLRFWKHDCMQNLHIFRTVVSQIIFLVTGSWNLNSMIIHLPSQLILLPYSLTESITVNEQNNMKPFSKYNPGSIFKYFWLL